MITMCQILAANSQSFQVAWPKGVGTLLAILAIVNVDLLPQFECLRKINHYGRLLAATTLPFVFIGGLLLFVVLPLDACARWRKARSKAAEPTTGNFFYDWMVSKQQHSKLTLLLIVVFFAYGNASQAIAQTFVCQRFDDEDASFLRIDLSIRCSGPSYLRWACYALLMTFVWSVSSSMFLTLASRPIGMPTLFVVLCWRSRDRINPLRIQKKEQKTMSPVEMERALTKAVAQRQFDHHIHKTKVLWFPYEPNFWYWESVVSTERMILTFVASLVKPGTPIQTIFCLCVAMLFLRLQTSCNPFCVDHDDLLAEGLAWMLIFFYVQVLLFTIGSISGLVMDICVCGTIAIALFMTLFLVFYDVKQELDIVDTVRSFLTGLCARTTRSQDDASDSVEVSVRSLGGFSDGGHVHDDDDQCEISPDDSEQIDEPEQDDHSESNNEPEQDDDVHEPSDDVADSIPHQNNTDVTAASEYVNLSIADQTRVDTTRV